MRPSLRTGNPFAFLFVRSRREEYLAEYVLREHHRGRPLSEILDDAYLRNRSSSSERARLLERPELVAAIGRHATDELSNSRTPAQHSPSAPAT